MRPSPSCAPWTEPTPRFDGTYSRFAGMPFSPSRSRSPPSRSSSAASAPRPYRAARCGDGWQPLGLSPDALRKGMAALRAEARAHGRDAAQIQVSLALNSRRDGRAAPRSAPGRARAPGDAEACAIVRPRRPAGLDGDDRPGPGPGHARDGSNGPQSLTYSAEPAHTPRREDAIKTTLATLLIIALATGALAGVSADAAAQEVIRIGCPTKTSPDHPCHGRQGGGYSRRRG